MQHPSPAAVALAALSVSAATLALPTSAIAGNVDFDALTYLGGPGDDAAGGVGILPDRGVVYGGTSTRLDYGAPTVDLLGGGTGVVSVFSPDGRTLSSVARLGTAVGDLDVAGGRIAVAASGAGPTVLAADGRTVVWNDPAAPTVSRISVGVAGNVAALTTGKQLRVYGPTGALIGTRQFGDTEVADVVVDDARGRVIVTGFNNRNTGREPAQVPFIRSFDATSQAALASDPVWRNYDFPGSVLRGVQDPNVADSRGVRVELGGDGKLYLAGRADGGNTTYFFDPQQLDRRLTKGGSASDEFIAYDAFSDAFNTKSEAKTVFGRFDPETGGVEHLQFLLARLSDGGGNTLRTTGIAADADGTMYLTGTTAFKIKDRDAATVNGSPVSPYAGGEVFVARISPDFLTREFWTVLTESGATDSGGVDVAVLDGQLALAATQKNATGTLFTVDAYQPANGGGTEGYLGVLGAPATIPEPALIGAVAPLALLGRRRRKM